MNFKLVSVAAALAVSAAVAQDYDDEFGEESAPATQSAPADSWDSKPAAADPAPAAPAAAPAQEAPVAEAAGSLNVLHGNAYNMVGSEAAASTIGGNMNAVYKMYGNNLLYVEPSGENATLALTKGGLTYLLAFDNKFSDDNTLGLVTAGFALNGFGVAIDFAIDKAWESEETKDPSTETDISTTGAADLINLKFGMLLGAFDLTANAYWLTFQQEVDTETDATEEDNDYWDLGLNVGISNGPSGKGLFWSAGLNVLRHASETTTENGAVKTEVTHEGAYFMIRPYFNFALPVLGTEKAQVYLGTNTRLPLVFFDDVGNDKNEYALYTSPNVLAEIALNENFIVYGGATYDWKLFGLVSEENKAAKTEGSTISMKTYTTSASAGFRFKYENLVLEASVADALGSSAWAGLIGHFGAFLVF